MLKIHGATTTQFIPPLRLYQAFCLNFSAIYECFKLVFWNSIAIPFDTLRLANAKIDILRRFCVGKQRERERETNCGSPKKKTVKKIVNKHIVLFVGHQNQQNECVPLMQSQSNHTKWKENYSNKWQVVHHQHTFLNRVSLASTIFRFFFRCFCFSSRFFAFFVKLHDSLSTKKKGIWKHVPFR